MYFKDKLTYHFGQHGEDEFEYEPNESDIKKELISCVKEEYPDLSDDDVAYMVEDNWYALFTEHEDHLKDVFKDEAEEQYHDAKAEERDPYAYYGVSRKDFH